MKHERLQPNAQEMRDAIQHRRDRLARDGRTPLSGCQHCHRCNDQNEWHHIWPRSKGGLNIPWNIIVLCSECHDEWHYYFDPGPDTSWEVLYERFHDWIDAPSAVIFRMLIKMHLNACKTGEEVTPEITDCFSTIMRLNVLYESVLRKETT